MLALRITIFATVLWQLSYGSNMKIFFENVDGVMGTQRSPYRENATHNGTIHLYKGDQVEILLCADDPVKIKLGALRYSNDGGSDTVNVYFKDSLVTTITTQANTGGFGDFWNQFEEKVINDTYVNLDVGEHVLLFTVPEADCYGVELDTFVLYTDVSVDYDAFGCGKSLIPAPVPSPCAPPDITTTSTSTTEATPPTKPTTGPSSTPLAEQLSKASECLADDNVNIKFNLRELVGLEFRAFSHAADTIKTPALVNSSLQVSSGCGQTIWKLGTADSSNAEFSGSEVTDAMFYVQISNRASDTEWFPGKISPLLTSQIRIRYTVQPDVSIEHGKVYFTLGLVNITKDTPVGVQYYDRAEAEQEEVEMVTFTPEQQVISWDLPAKSVSPSLENKLNIFFGSSGTEPVLFDFLRLDSMAKPERTKSRILAKSKLFRAKGRVYGSTKRRPATKGMKVVADDKVSEHVEELSLSVRPQGKGRLNSVLTITEDGKIVPRHDTIKSVRGTRKYKGSVLEGLSGFIFGNGSGVKELIVDTATQMINLTYKDGSTLRLVFDYNPIRTKIVVLESTVNENTLHFVSTYLTDQLSAVNALVTRKGSIPDVRHILGSLDDVTSRQISFVKTSTNRMFEAIPEIKVTFPHGAM